MPSRKKTPRMRAVQEMTKTALILVIMTIKKTMISRTPKFQAKKTQKRKKRLKMTKVKKKT